MTTFARLISWIGHPLVFVLASVAVVVGTQLGPRTGLPILLALLLSTLVPTAILLLSGVRSGRWSDADVSVRKERQRFFPWAVPFSLAGVIAMWWLQAPSYIIRGGMVTLGLFLVSWLANFQFEIVAPRSLCLLLRDNSFSNRSDLGRYCVGARGPGGMVAIVSAAPYSHRTNCRNLARPNGRIRRRLVVK